MNIHSENKFSAYVGRTKSVGGISASYNPYRFVDIEYPFWQIGDSVGCNYGSGNQHGFVDRLDHIN